MIKFINNINYLLTALFISLFPAIFYPKMLQATTAPKYFLMVFVSLLFVIMILLDSVFKNSKKDDRTGVALIVILVLSSWAVFQALGSLMRGDLTVLLGVENTGFGLVLILCAGLIFAAGRALQLDQISKKNLLWFYTIGVNISFLIWALGTYFASIVAEFGRADLQLAVRSAFSDQTIFMIFTVSLIPVLVGLLFIEKNLLLRILAAAISIVDLAAAVSILSGYQPPAGSEYWQQISNSISAYASSDAAAMIFGSGFGSFQDVYFQGVRAGAIMGDISLFPQTAPTMALETLITYGIVGLMSLIFLGVYFAKEVLSHSRSSLGEDPLFAYSMAAAASVFFVSFFFVPANFQTVIMCALFIGLAVSKKAQLPVSNFRSNAAKGMITEIALLLIASSLVFTSSLAYQNIQTDLIFVQADVKDDLAAIRLVGASDNLSTDLSIAVARYIIFVGYADKDEKLIGEGFAVLERISSKRPDELNMLNEISNNSFLVNDHVRAIMTLKKMLKVDSRSTNILNGIGFANFKKGELEESLIYYKRSLTINGKKPITYFLIRDVYLKLGDETRAREHGTKGKALQDHARQ